MKNLNSLLAVLAIFCCMAVSSAQETLIKRINCGGAQVTGADGLVYEADASNSEVSFTSNSTTMNIGYVAPLVEPYRSFRMMGRNTASEFDYTFTNLQSGQYKVILHFAEPYHGVENTGWDTRRFDIDINNGEFPVSNFNIMSAAAGEIPSSNELDGARKVYKLVAGNLNVTGGGLTIKFNQVANDPMVNAIEVFKLDNTSDTQAPTIPTNVVASSATDTSVRLSWNASSDNESGIARYRIWLESGNSGQYSIHSSSGGGATSYTVSGLSPNNGYRFKVSAQDNNSPMPNESSLSAASASITTLSSSSPSTGDAISISGYNSTGSVNGFRNMIELVGQPHGAIVYNPGESNELMFGMHDNGYFYWGTGGPTATRPNYYAMRLNGTNGDLGIRGKLISKEVKVDADGWADYVFSNHYRLPSLDEVERHINEKGHLINIPSAAEVEANGIELGEMNKLLLEKIEELTLYILEQNKTIDNLQDRVSKLEPNLEKGTAAQYH